MRNRAVQRNISNSYLREASRLGTMVEALRKAFERAEQQSEAEQAALAADIMTILDDDARWDALLRDPLTSEALDALAAGTLAEDNTDEDTLLGQPR